MESGMSTEIPPPCLRAALDAVMAASLRPLSVALGLLYTVFAVSHAASQPPQLLFP